MSALFDILRKGGGYWPRPPKGPGRAVAVPNGARFRIVLPPEEPLERPSGGPRAESLRATARASLGRLLRRKRPARPEHAADATAPTYITGVCRDGAFALDGGRAFDTAEDAARAAGLAGDPFDGVEFLVGRRWMSADALRRSDALPWDEADELALAIAADAIRAKLKEDGEAAGDARVWRKAADAAATFPYFLAEARERLRWIRT